LNQRAYLSVVVPAYNEARSIGATLASIRSFLDRQGYAYEVIVAVDGDDDTPQVVEGLQPHWPQLQLTAERGRHGKGQGVRRGMRLASGQIVGFVDADNKTPIDELTRLLPWLTQGFDIVIGSRALAESRIEVRQPMYRQLGSRVFAFGMRAIVGLPHIHDTQCGFKFFSNRAAVEIFGRARIDGYMCDVEILWLAQKLGYPVKEVGIRWRDDGDSRLDLVRGNARNLIELLRIRFQSVPATSIYEPATRPAIGDT
jgi:dolichyl-phosphate beta-glucosyltransferase